MMALKVSIFLLFFVKSLTASTQDFVLFTPPKCGTHLICNVLSYMLRRPPHITDQFNTISELWSILEEDVIHNSFLVSHSFTKEMLEDLISKNYKIIFILRDPRDQLISMMYWMQRGYWNEFQAAFIKDQNEQIDELITGDRFGWRCYEGCIGIRLGLLQNLNPNSTYISRYETLVGREGGGDHQVQLEEIKNLAKFLNFEISDPLTEEISENIYGFGWSFREGKVGAWKRHFLPYQEQIYNLLYKETLIKLGYE